MVFLNDKTCLGARKILCIKISFRFCLLFSEVPNISEPNQEFIQMAKQVSNILFLSNNIVFVESK